ncbi:MAG: hypothetical protein C7B47_01630 [Sulfobacillus thermosulfidooxidans]|uniref:Peptidase M50 domain-containing protein n=1 Tax=Sulfobacillus thermosulfidooxidans TaxID=28034 RepID=A0A2T2X4M1_SULTH|nr:MAG: hypothetical protein C7B47_01630 [Sulfobacillus thermosulfidooxidans]
MLALDISVLIAAIVNALAHESAHGIVARHLGGHWLGLRWRSGRLSTAIDMTGLNVKAHRQIAMAGVLVDLAMALVSSLLWFRYGLSWAKGPVIWTSVSLLINGCPLIPHSDGWQIIFGGRHLANPKG